MNPVNFHCPACEHLATLALSEVQAMCGNEQCHVLMFNPSLPDGGMRNPHFVDMPDLDNRDRES
jgi:hypothetical protein